MGTGSTWRALPSRPGYLPEAQPPHSQGDVHRHIYGVGETKHLPHNRMYNASSPIPTLGFLCIIMKSFEYRTSVFGLSLSCGDGCIWFHLFFLFLNASCFPLFHLMVASPVLLCVGCCHVHDFICLSQLSITDNTVGLQEGRLLHPKAKSSISPLTVLAHFPPII